VSLSWDTIISVVQGVVMGVLSFYVTSVGSALKVQ
jgi:hypothetical protein